MVRSFLLAMAFFCAPTLALATPVTLTFDEFSCGADFAFQGQQGSVNYHYFNHYKYGECGSRVLIGNDGHNNDIVLKADQGTTFDLNSFDATSLLTYQRIRWDNLTKAGAKAVRDVAGLGEVNPVLNQMSVGDGLTRSLEREDISFEAVLIEGFRGKTRVASDVFDPGLFDPYGSATAPQSLFQAGNDFRDLTSLRISLRIGLGAPHMGDAHFFTCRAKHHCGSVLLDNVALTTRATPDPRLSFGDGTIAPVPLPASLWGLGGGIALLGALRRKRRT